MSLTHAEQTLQLGGNDSASLQFVTSYLITGPGNRKTKKLFKFCVFMEVIDLSAQHKVPASVAQTLREMAEYVEAYEKDGDVYDFDTYGAILFYFIF